MSQPKATALPCTDLTPPPVPTPRVVAEETDWKRAYVVLGIMVGSGFLDSLTLSKYVESVRQNAGQEAADLLARIVNESRPQWVHDLMG